MGGPVALSQQGEQIGWIDGPGCLALGEGPIAQGDQVGLQLFLLVRVQGLYRPCWWGIKEVNRCHALTATRVAIQPQEERQDGGVGVDLAAPTAGSPHGPWRI